MGNALTLPFRTNVRGGFAPARSRGIAMLAEIDRSAFCPLFCRDLSFRQPAEHSIDREQVVFPFGPVGLRNATPINQGRVIPHSQGPARRLTCIRRQKASPSTYMKHHDSAQSAGPQLEPVGFEFAHPTAITVCGAGTFNDWQPKATPMLSLRGGRWHNDSVLPPGTCEYCLIVDGQCQPDLLAKESEANPFGGRNSPLTVARSPAAIHRADAEHLPLEDANQPMTPTL